MPNYEEACVSNTTKLLKMPRPYIQPQQRIQKLWLASQQTSLWAITKENNNANNRLVINWIPSPISITIGKKGRIARSKSKNIVKSASNVPQNEFRSLQMVLSRITHILTCLMNSKGKIKSGKGEVLKSTHQASIRSWIR